MATRLVKELAEFNGDLSLEGLHFWRTVFSAMTHPAPSVTSSSHVPRAGNSEVTKDQTSPGDKVILLPCRNPPRRERVQLWLEARKQYESLHNVRQEKKAEMNVEVNPEGYKWKSMPCEKLLNIEIEKDSIQLMISPLRITVSPPKSTEVSPISDGASVYVKKHRGKNDNDDDDLAVPLESPELPSWLQRTISEIHPLSPSLSPLKKNKENSSPLSISNKEENDTSPVLNSTPILKRQRRHREELEPLWSTPISKGKELSGVAFFFFSVFLLNWTLFSCDPELWQKTLPLRDCNNREETRLTHSGGCY